MKKTTLLLVSALLITSLGALAQNKKYTQAMKKQIVLLDSAKKSSDFERVSAGFERLAKIDKTDWLPNYYAAYGYILSAFEKEGREVDNCCDKADKLIDRADSLSKKNSEIEVLKAMSAAARIMVDPMGRGWQFGKISFDCANEAASLNPENPRCYFHKGQSLYFTPESFGGGPAKAKPFFEKAVAKYKVFKPQTEIHPNWGKAQAEKLLKECIKEE